MAQTCADVVFIGATNYTITPALVLSGAFFWTRAANPLSVAEVYTALAFLLLCASPLITLLRSSVSWATGLASIGRIYDYLVLDELRDSRQVPCRMLQAERTPTEKSKKPFAIELSNASVKSRIVGFVLKDISLKIPWGDLTMIWGPINSGKSALAKLLLGEAELSDGTVSIGCSTAAYCSQEPWIPNCTILEAVIGTLPLVEARYRAVIRACALDLDIQQLPQGDNTLTGSGGCHLSGGQRQRLVSFLFQLLSTNRPRLITYISVN